MSQQKSNLHHHHTEKKVHFWYQASPNKGTAASSPTSTNIKMLKSVLLLALVRLCRACELDIWVFDSLNHCNAPDAADKIIADGECRSVGLTSQYPFPGYYRATCDGNGVEFSVSGCRDSSCQQCEKDELLGETLYQTANTHIPIQPHSDSLFGTDFLCYSLASKLGVSINFAFYGTCQCPTIANPGPMASLPTPQNTLIPSTPATSPPSAAVRSSPSPIVSVPVVYFGPIVWSPTPWSGLGFSEPATSSVPDPQDSPSLSPTTSTNDAVGGSRFSFTNQPSSVPEREFSWKFVTGGNTNTFISWDAVASSSNKNSWSALGMVAALAFVALGI